MHRADSAPPEALFAMLEGVIRGRRSIRHYRPALVPRPAVEAVLAAAACAPAPHHSAPWRFAVLSRRAARARLADSMGAAWRRDLTADGVPAERSDALVRRSRERLLGAPVLIVVGITDERFDRYPDAERQLAEQLMFAHSVGAALQNAMLAAHAAGLATCWMCAPLFCPDAVRACLDLGRDWWPQALLTLGYAAEPPPPRPPVRPDAFTVLWD